MRKIFKLIKNTILTLVIASSVILILPAVVDVIGGMMWDGSSDDKPSYTQSSSQSKDTSRPLQNGTDGGVSSSATGSTQKPTATTSASSQTQKPTEKVHLYLDAMNDGSCRQLVGRVVVTVIFVGDSESSWTSADVSEAKHSLSAQESALERAAGSHGASLDIVYNYLTASIGSAIPLDPDDDEKWQEQAAENAGIASFSSAAAALESKHSADEAPVVFAVNKSGRSYAQQMSGDRTEFSCVFGSDMESFSHELLHLFGAMDFYYPSAITALCETHLGDSVMNGGERVDDLTAFIVGWTSRKSTGAQSFLDGSAVYTSAMLDAEREKENYTGYGTKTSKNGTYTGYMTFGTPDGQGKFVYTDGTSYEGNFKVGVYDGQGTYIYSDGSKYTGAWVDGTQQGQGKYTFASGSVYVGSFAGGKFEGQGRMTYADGAVYDGAWSDGKRHGQGKLTYADGVIYEGAWSEGNKHGQGRLTYTDGAVYVGSFVSDEIEGQGKMAYAGGAIYEGAWKNGKRHGQGKLIYADGATYTGAWYDGKKHGQGKITFTGGAAYEGSFVSDQFDGQGKYTFASGTVYVGSFVAGKFEGQGKATYTDGSSYEGAWSDGNRHGQGTYTYPSGASYTGAWVEGKQHGQGTYTYADGTTRSGVWENGNFVG